ncbi:hypothetical protein H9Q72_009339 [Fusarium xylarioides]|uniref:Uncharacterized protein n=1 Tax=Fusarium xylarioides TaxID=221167 RepID=A0A9P7HLN7_9HYPO|nr:hypothetical protein H9Q70_009849 [Fusarium xylarioides]KAG5762557.1 hypothetical protein H9Q72_009339 [Fusarium xylarioides]
MANDDNTKKTQKDPENKDRDKDGHKPLISDHNPLAFEGSQDIIGQQQSGLVGRRTGQLALNEMCVTTGFKDKTKYSFSASTLDGAHEALDAIVSALKSALKPGDCLTCFITSINWKLQITAPSLYKHNMRMHTNSRSFNSIPQRRRQAVDERCSVT